MKRWTEFVLVACAAGVALAQWVVPATMQGVLSVLLLALVALTIFSQRNALQLTVGSLNAAHLEQLESERRYRALFDACSDAILVYRLEGDGRPGQLVEINEAACRSLGYPRKELLSMTAEDVHAPEARRNVQERSQALREAGSLVFETVYITGDGRRLPVEVSARLVEIGSRRLCLAVGRSIAVHKELEGFLRDLTDRDELTGLLNRRGFFALVGETRRRARRDGAQVLVMYLDVDGLKRVNDEMGHAAGDAVLIATGDALRLAFREEDVLARLGGDEFVALAVLGRCDDERLDLQAIEARFEGAVRAKRKELGEACAFAVSFGSLVVTGDELREIDELLARTDKRMYKAKRSRRRTSGPIRVVASVTEETARITAGQALGGRALPR
ncbi:MAG: sensor domain-containing diguanylate cyclase [Actinobacteria bacterium]|nr:sensor domain-containing diguanylate cyclase [Actinomycetota bacterium]